MNPRLLISRILLLFLISPGVSFAFGEKENEFDKLVQKRREILTGGDKFNKKDPDIQLRIKTIEAEAEKHWNKMDKMLWRAFLWNDLNSFTISSQITQSYSRLRSMALAYSVVGSRLEKNKALRDDILFAIDWMYKNKYNEKSKPYDNWWDWEIGTPLILNDILVLLYNDLSKDQKTKFTNAILNFSSDPEKMGSGKSETTGVNRVWKSSVLAVTAAVVGDVEKLKAARTAMLPVFKYAEHGDGFHKDGSFLQHDKHPYTGGYGLSLISNLSELLFLLRGSPWEVKNEEVRNVDDWIFKSFLPVTHKGVVMDLVQGRTISRPSNSFSGSYELIKSALFLSQTLGHPQSTKYKQLVKLLLNYEKQDEVLLKASIYIIQKLKGLEADKTIQPYSFAEGIYIFPQMDRVVSRRKLFDFGLSMFSERIYNYESINHENLKGWFTGYGMTYVYTSEGLNYPKEFWPTVDSYRLSGTTVSSKIRSPGSSSNKTSSRNWVGGAALDGYGAIGMELADVGGSLEARKSWFVFDDEIIALGSGIHCEDEANVESIIENRALNIENAVFTANNENIDPENLKNIESAEWVHLTDASKNTGIGFYFPKYYDLNARIEERRNHWKEINKNPQFSDTAQVVANYFTLWFNHGLKPKAADYEYVILPSKTAEQTKEYNKNPDVAIIQNTSAIQAVKERNLNLIAANFWANQKNTLSVDADLIILCDKKAALLCKENGEEVEISLADPTQTNEGVITVELPNRVAREIISKDEGVELPLNEPSVKVLFNVKDSKGKTFHVKFRKAILE